MSEGIGITSVLVIIVVFVAFVSGYMAYNVNYTKAFRMKNKIVALYEKYDGVCGASDCQVEIQNYAKSIGYYSPRPSELGFCTQETVLPAVEAEESKNYNNPGYCIYKIREDADSMSYVDYSKRPGYYYHVVTCINISVPIVQDVFPKFLTVSGDTKTFSDNI